MLLGSNRSRKTLKSRDATHEAIVLAAIVESSDDAILSEDLDGIIQTWNPAARRLFGYTTAQIVGKPITTLIPPDRQHEEEKFLARIRRGRRVQHYETVRRHKTGRLIDVSLSLSPVRDPRGRIVGASKIVRDISERNRQQAELRDSEARTRAIVETAVDAIIVIDERGIIDSANPAAEKLFGYDLAEMRGRNVKMLMPEPYQSEHDDYMRSYLRTGQARIIGIGREVTGLRKDKTTFPMSLAVAEMKLGERRMFTGIVHDLTDRRRLEREVLDATTNEQRRIGQDIHDGLCQELVSLSLAAELSAQKLDSAAPKDAAAVRKLGDEIQAAAEQARRLSHGLNPIDVEAGGLLGALEQLTKRVSNSTGIRCELEWDGQPLDHQSAEIMTNLYRIAQEAVSNAVKHAEAECIKVILRDRSSLFTLQVIDDGKGIPRAKRKPQAPHAPSPAGVGIGMQTMNYRARVIGGELTVAPGTKGGTVVTCSLRLRRQL